MTGRTSITGSLLKDYSDMHEAKHLRNVYNVLNKIGIRSGIYILYNDNELYYVGKAINLKNRLRDHTKDQHAKKWNKFRIFLIKNKVMLDDIEKMLITVSRPIGNGNKGIFPKHHDLEEKIQKEIQTNNT